MGFRSQARPRQPQSPRQPQPPQGPPAQVTPGGWIARTGPQIWSFIPIARPNRGSVARGFHDRGALCPAAGHDAPRWGLPAAGHPRGSGVAGVMHRGRSRMAAGGVRPARWNHARRIAGRLPRVDAPPARRAVAGLRPCELGIRPENCELPVTARPLATTASTVSTPPSPASRIVRPLLWAALRRAGARCSAKSLDRRRAEQADHSRPAP